ncbi:MAG TPA: ribbon-helix-helix protein, CopG family [Polyangiaceae bacterium]|nr:ribbon-helix-helix protein, CopG family [Polyangiaceae bacterium]
MPEPLLSFRFDAEDRALLDACSAHEKLTKSDIMRRALREYATKLGVTAEEPKRQRPKPKRK